MDGKLELSKKECEAVASYIWNACRSSPNGQGFKVWSKMWAFIIDEPIQAVKVEAELPLFSQSPSSVAVLDAEKAARQVRGL